MSLKQLFIVSEGRMDEVDPTEPKPKLSHPGHSMPSGIAGKSKPQMQPPRSTAKSAPPPTKRVDPATEFLRSKGALSGLKGPGSGNTPPPKGAPKGRSEPGEPRAPGSAAPASRGPLQPDEKPKYPGKYVGQTIELGGRFVPKRTAWQVADPATGERSWRGGKTDVKQTDYAVWNGSDWLSQSDFDDQFKRK